MTDSERSYVTDEEIAVIVGVVLHEDDDELRRVLNEMIEREVKKAIAGWTARMRLEDDEEAHPNG